MNDSNWEKEKNLNIDSQMFEKRKSKNSSLKRWVIVMISILSVMTVLIIATMIGGIMGMNFGFSGFSKESSLIKEENISSNGIKKLNIDTDDCSIRFSAGSGNSINIQQYGPSNSDDDDKFTISQNGDTLKIEKRHQIFKFSFFVFTFPRLLIEVPSNWYGNVTASTASGGITLSDEFNWEEVKLKALSGGIGIDENLTAKKLSADSSSGSIKCLEDLKIEESIKLSTLSGGIRLKGNITSQELKASSSSGGFSCDGDLNITDEVKVNALSGSVKLLRNITSNKVELESSSGGIKGGKINASNFNIHSRSGSTNIESLSGSGSIASSSGGIKIDNFSPKDNVELSCLSGGINISLPKDLSFTFNAKVTSGGVHTDFPTSNEGRNYSATVGENPTASIKLDSSSGGITVKQGL